MKKILFSLICFIFLAGVSFAAENKEYYDIKTGSVPVKRCECKKYFVEHLELTKEQVEFMDKNRAECEAKLVPVNEKIKTNVQKIKDLKASDLSKDTKKKKIEKLNKKNVALRNKTKDIKAACTKKFENSLTDEQMKTLEHMRELKKEGKSCCPCGKNRYY